MMVPIKSLFFIALCLYTFHSYTDKKVEKTRTK